MSKQSLQLGYGFYLSFFSLILLTTLAIHFPGATHHLFNQSIDYMRHAENHQKIADFLSAISYIAGVSFGIKAAVKMKEHNETGGKTPLSQPITLGLVAAILIAFPTMMTSATECTFGTSRDVQKAIN
jgi:hypothetical protein